MIGLLVDAIQRPNAATREFALSCLSEIGDLAALGPMVNLLEDRDPTVREMAAEHLTLLTHKHFGQDAAKWRDWQHRRVAGIAEQAEQDHAELRDRIRHQMRKRNANRDAD